MLQLTRRLSVLLLPLVAALLFSGCATGNSYGEFYTDHTARAAVVLAPPVATPTVHHVTEASSEDMVAKLYRAGYVVVGQSSFTGRINKPEAQLIEHAKAVGAAHVVSSIAHDETVTGSMPVVTYTPPETTTTYTQGTANAAAYGQGGSGVVVAQYSGSSVSQTSGKISTTQVPYAVDRYRYRAYFLRRSHSLFGVATRPLSDAERARFQRNGGVVVVQIIDDSPAFKANILVGDVITAIGAEAVGTAQGLSDLVHSHAGQAVSVSIIRNGEERAIQVTFGKEQSPAPSQSSG